MKAYRLNTNRPFKSGKSKSESFKRFIKEVVSSFNREHECTFRKKDVEKLVNIFPANRVNIKFQFPDDEENIYCVNCGNPFINLTDIKK